MKRTRTAPTFSTGTKCLDCGLARMTYRHPQTGDRLCRECLQAQADYHKKEMAALRGVLAAMTQYDQAA